MAPTCSHRRPRSIWHLSHPIRTAVCCASGQGASQFPSLLLAGQTTGPQQGMAANFSRWRVAMPVLHADTAGGRRRRCRATSRTVHTRWHCPRWRGTSGTKGGHHHGWQSACLLLMQGCARALALQQTLKRLAPGPTAMQVRRSVHAPTAAAAAAAAREACMPCSRCQGLLACCLPRPFPHPMHLPPPQSLALWGGVAGITAFWLTQPTDW